MNKDEARAAEKRRSRNRKLLALEVACIVIAVVCVGVVVQQASRYVIADREFSQLTAETGRDVTTLVELYGDAVGWIYVEDTRIDYPVMWTPEEPEYYLHRNADGDYSYAGTPFLGEGSDPDEPTTNSMIVYAHHMRDGSMFAQLEKFESSTFAEEHEILYTDLSGQHSYRVVAAWHEDLSGSDYYRYWDNVGTLDEEAFEAYVQAATERSLYATDCTAAYGDELLALSTCSSGTSEERFVVLAVKVATDESTIGIKADG